MSDWTDEVRARLEAGLGCDVYPNDADIRAALEQLELGGLAQDLCDKVDDAMRGVRLSGESLNECAARLRQRVEELERESVTERRFTDRYIKRLHAAEAKLAEAEEHERQTHERLGAILGTDDSLEQCAKRLKAEVERLEWALAEIIELEYEPANDSLGGEVDTDSTSSKVLRIACAALRGGGELPTSQPARAIALCKRGGGE